jgi:hypothetical protein
MTPITGAEPPLGTIPNVPGTSSAAHPTPSSEAVQGMNESLELSPQQRTKLTSLFQRCTEAVAEQRKLLTNLTRVENPTKAEQHAENFEKEYEPVLAEALRQERERAAQHKHCWTRRISGDTNAYLRVHRRTTPQQLHLPKVRQIGIRDFHLEISLQQHHFPKPKLLLLLPLYSMPTQVPPSTGPARSAAPPQFLKSNPRTLPMVIYHRYNLLHKQHIQLPFKTVPL